jgi:hypothetical protein
METQKKTANRWRRERSPKQEYLKFVNWCPEGEEEGALYRRAAGAGGMNLDVMAASASASGEASERARV